jgi:CRISPR-associated protein Cas1
MHELLNTLFVTTDRSYLHLDHDTVRLEAEGVTHFRMPLLPLGALVCFGDVLLSPALLRRCAEDGRAVVLLDHNGRFKARLEGAVNGNVLLRRAQHQALDDATKTLDIARNCVAGKLQNSRQILLRGAREADAPEDRQRLAQAARKLGESLASAERSAAVDELRGCEGDAARTYFAAFNELVREDRATFAFKERSRRPPLDAMNALISFLYTLLLADCVAAVEGVGLDPQVGYLHALRPGRPALALDLIEELRSVLADRVALSLINRRQLQAEDFVTRDGGSVSLTERGRKEVLIAYQKRKADEVRHRVLDRSLPLGLVPHVQARLLARHLRGDLPEYLPFVYR